MNKRYNVPNIRTLLSEGFTPEELRHLCQDEPGFRDVCDQLTRQSSKAEMIDVIIEHAKQKLQFETLLAWANQNNPGRYNLHQPYSSPEANSGASPQGGGESNVHGPSPGNSTFGIPSHLTGRLRQALLDCGPFDNDRELRAVFADARLSPWRYHLPQADSLTSRVDAIIDFLHTRQQSDTQANALVLLLQVLSERINPGDACHHQLKSLASELEAAWGSGALPAQPGDSPGPTRDALIEGSPMPSLPPVGPIRNRWALLVGINRYIDPTFKTLNFCVADVVALADTLKEAGYTVVMLHDEATEERLQPDNENIEAELIRLCQVAQPEDLLWVHFACHGQVLNGEPILITRRTRQTTLAKSALPLAEVERLMRASQARRLVLTLDACHVGVDIGRASSDPEFIRHAHDLAEGFALIAASTAQQKAQEWQAEQHGVFTYYLLAGLNGGAARGQPFVTVDDLKTYVLDHLRRWSVENGGLLQEPSARTEGLGDMILVDFREPQP